MTTGDVTWDLLPGGARAGLREVCGYDEEAVHGADTISAIQLLDRLLIAAPGTSLQPGSAARLTAADRDRLLAAVYQQTYGPRIEGTVPCTRCGTAFDLDFSLPDLLADLGSRPRTTGVEKGPAGVFVLPDGRCFRLPTGEDEYAVWHLPPDEAEKSLLARCMVEGDATAEPAAVQAAMWEAAPLLDVELEARCPECGEVQPIHFDLQSHLLSALLSERQQLTREVHRLATTYRWSLPDILGLARSQRRALVALIEAEAAPTR
jgi:hypothetical protein